MRSPAAAMAWQLWRRYRWLALAGAGWYVTASIVCRLLPANVNNDVVVFLTAGPMLLLLGWQVAVFTYGSEADLSTKESGYPSWMLRHPVSVRLLVGWPMFLGVMTVGAIWMAIAPAVFRSRGMDVLILRPALMCGAMLAWSQALVWSPFGLGWFRVIAAVGVIATVVFIALLDVICGLPETVIMALLAGQLPAAYWVAMVGVSRARRGDTPEWRWLPTAVERVAAWLPRRGRPFGSAIGAQVWFEWRRHGLGPPLMVGIFLPMGIVFILLKHASPLWLLPLSAYMAVLGVGVFGDLESTKGNRGLPSFLFVRPISSMDLIRAKYLVVAKSWLLVCVITALAVAVCMILSGRFAEINVLRELSGYDSWWSHPAIVVPVAFLLFWAFCWLSVIQGSCVFLAGRLWVSLGVGAVGGALLVTLILSGLWLSMHSEYHQTCLNAAPWLVAGLAAAKLALAGYVLSRAWGRRLLETRAVALLVGSWMIVVLASVGLVVWLVPSGVLPLGLTMGISILVFPLTRLALAPLALAWNRHR